MELTSTVWYSWTAETNGIVYFSGSATNPDFAFNVGAYQGNAVNSLSNPSSTLDGGIFMEPGEVIQLQVSSLYNPGGAGGGTGPFTLNIEMLPRAPASANDDFANRVDVSIPTFHTVASIYSATNEPGEPLPVANQPQTLWWRFVPPDDGLIRVTLTAPYPMSQAVYEGADFGSLIPLNAAGGNRYRILAGHEYAIQIASGIVLSGGIRLDTLFRSTSNDMFAAREYRQGSNWTYQGNFTFATREAGEPQLSATNTVWMSWTAPFTGRALFTKASAPQFQTISVYTGNSLATLQPVSMSGLINGISTFLAVEGTPYHFQFAGGADDFSISLALNPFLYATNDNFSSAQIVRGENTYCDASSFAGATMETGEPEHMGSVPQKSLWWKWQAPRSGNMDVFAQGSLLTNHVVFAVYQGTAVNALTLVSKSTNSFRTFVTGGQTYYLAAAVPAETLGDILPSVTLRGALNIVPPVPGNLLGNPSWENTGVIIRNWNISSNGVGGHYNTPFGSPVDGVNWPSLSSDGKIWQDIPTIPAHEYAIRFAYRAGGPASVRVTWDGVEVDIAHIPAGDGYYWHWSEFVTTATQTNSRVLWESLAGAAEMDVFSVIDLRAPPAILAQPSSISTLIGANALFLVDAAGAMPLHYQWRFNGVPLTNESKPLLTLNLVNASAAGAYTVVITNRFGAITSEVATLTLDAPTNATILVQPYGDLVFAGGFYSFNVVAAGLAPLRYQWFFDGHAIASATNRNLSFTNVSLTNAGSYEVLVQNNHSSVMSLAATLSVTNAAAGGGMVLFANRDLINGIVAPVYDVGGTIPLVGSAYSAQLYAGTSVETLRAAGMPIPFRVNPAGFVIPQTVVLPNIPPGGNVYLQMRAWESARGITYEEARATGGKFGRSLLLLKQLLPPPAVPTPMTGLQSFSLQSGLPRFSVGVISLLEVRADGTVIWSVKGEPGFRYLVEKSIQPSGPVWRPYLTVTNVTGTVTFSDAANLSGQAVLYRSRILD